MEDHSEKSAAATPAQVAGIELGALVAEVAALRASGGQNQSTTDLSAALQALIPLAGAILGAGKLAGLADNEPLENAAHDQIWFGAVDRDAKGGWLLSDRPAPGHLVPARFEVPDSAVDCTEEAIKNLIWQIVPIRQLRQILQHLWHGCKLGPCAMDGHIADLVRLASADPAACKLVLKGDLRAAESHFEGTDWLPVIRRHAVVWVVGDIIRTARLIGAVNEGARTGTALTDVAVRGRRRDNGDVKNGALLGTMSTLAKGLIALPGWYQQGETRPAHCPNQLVSSLQAALENSPEVKALEAKLEDSGQDFRAQIGTMLPQLSNFVAELDDARRRTSGSTLIDPETSGEISAGSNQPIAGTCAANETVFSSIFSIAPLVALAVVGLRATQALQMIRDAVSSPSKMVMNDLANMPWVAALRLPVAMKIVIHICRVELLGLEEQNELGRFGGERLVDWDHADFEDPDTYKAACVEMDSRKLLQKQLREARTVIGDLEDPSPIPQVCEEYFESIEKYFDLSFKFRN